MWYNPSAKTNFDNSWIKKHISKSFVQSGKKKLTFFLDTLLTYDFKKRSKNQTDERGIELQPELRPVQTSTSDSIYRDTELEVTVKRESPSTKETVRVQNEVEKEQTKLQFEEYISETWEKYRKRYEHLGEKNPFASDPPSPEFLLQKQTFSGEREQQFLDENGSKYKSEDKNEDASLTTCEDKLEKIDSPISDDEHLSNIDDLKYVSSASILEKNKTINSIDPELEAEEEEIDYESESGSESDQILNCDDSFLPVDGEPQLGDDVTEVQAHDSKESVANFMEDNVIERSSEYDGLKYDKPKRHSIKTTVPDVRSLSSNKENFSPERIVHSINGNKVHHGDVQRAEKGSRVFRKAIKRPLKQYVKTSTQEPLRPLVNPYLVSPFGGPPMIPQQHTLFPFQPFNFWMPKPPYNQFNMFPYGYPWQSLPFVPSYFQPFFNQGLTANPCAGSPTPLVGDHNIAPATSAQGLQNDLSTDLSTGFSYGPANLRLAPEIPTNETEEFKSNYNQMKKLNRPYQPHVQKSEFSHSQPGSPAQHQHVHSFHQRLRVNKGSNQHYRHDQKWIPENEINNGVSSPNIGRESMQMFDAPENRQNQIQNPYNPRISTSLLPPGEFRTPVSPSPPNQQWNRENANLGTSGHKFINLPSPYIHQQQQRTNYQTQQYGTPTNEQLRNRFRLNNEFPPTHYPHYQPPGQVQPSSYQPWFTEPPPFGHGNYSHPNERTE